jgi:hypothetical protein
MLLEAGAESPPLFHFWRGCARLWGAFIAASLADDRDDHDDHLVSAYESYRLAAARLQASMPGLPDLSLRPDDDFIAWARPLLRERAARDPDEAARCVRLSIRQLVGRMPGGSTEVDDDGPALAHPTACGGVGLPARWR